MAKSTKWTFKGRFRTNAYGWKGTAVASKRLREAVSEIKKVNKSNPIAAADGAVALVERLWPALQGIDGSSGALGVAVNRTLDALIPIVIAAPADQTMRTTWLERLYEAKLEDGVDYLSPVEEQWGELCVFSELANHWADELLPLLRETWSKNEPGGWVTGGSICLSCLLKVERYKELQQLISLRSFDFWHFDKFWAEALAQQGKIDEAITFAESRRHDRSEYDAPGIAEFCERVLLEADRREEAYQRFGLEVSRATTNLATYRRIVKKYPEREPRQIALDLIAAFGPPGKWFAAAKDAGFLDLALECARDVDADPSTLIRAARDFTEDAPEFAAPVALLALEHLLAGHGYEPMPLDVMQAHRHLMAAAGKAGSIPSARTAVERLIQTKSASANEPLRRVLEAVHRRSARH